MLINVKGMIDPSHFDIVLAEGLVNEKGDFYDLTFKQNFDELCGDESYVCNYQVDLQKSLEACKIMNFTAWTKTKIIYMDDSPFTRDRLLYALPRNPT